MAAGGSAAGDASLSDRDHVGAADEIGHASVRLRERIHGGSQQRRQGGEKDGLHQPIVVWKGKPDDESTRVHVESEHPQDRQEREPDDRGPKRATDAAGAATVGCLDRQPNRRNQALPLNFHASATIGAAHQTRMATSIGVRAPSSGLFEIHNARIIANALDAVAASSGPAGGEF